MRRAVNEILDPTPTSIEPLWDYFEGRCAYCGTALQGRQGHVDHAVVGGGNYFGNLILACSTCNGDEKREQGWEDFLRTKASGDDLVQREARIRAWFERHGREPLPRSAAVEQALAEAEGLVEMFGAKCRELKELVRKPPEGRGSSSPT